MWRLAMPAAIGVNQAWAGFAGDMINYSLPSVLPVNISKSNYSRLPQNSVPPANKYRILMQTVLVRWYEYLSGMTVFCHMIYSVPVPYVLGSRGISSHYGRNIHTLWTVWAGVVEAFADRLGCGGVVRIAGCGDDLVPAGGDAVAGQAGAGERALVPLY